jgi:hypothetical protein
MYKFFSYHELFLDDFFVSYKGYNLLQQMLMYMTIYVLRPYILSPNKMLLHLKILEKYYLLQILG